MSAAGAPPPSPDDNADAPWYIRCGIINGSDDLDIHEVGPETFAEVHVHDDGSATFDEGWGGAWIETDLLANLEEWR